MLYIIQEKNIFLLNNWYNYSVFNRWTNIYYSKLKTNATSILNQLKNENNKQMKYRLIVIPFDEINPHD